MKIGIISDIHGNIDALEEVYFELNPRVDKIFCLGDLTGYYPWSNEVIQFISYKNIKSILGNHEYYLFNKPKRINPLLEKSIELNKMWLSNESINYIKSLNQSFTLEEIPIREIGLFHSTPWGDLEQHIYPGSHQFSELFNTKYSTIFLGHTHKPYLVKKSGRCVVNVGSVGQPRDKSGNLSFAIYDVDSQSTTLHSIQFDWIRFLKKVKDNGTVPDGFLGPIFRYNQINI